MTTRLFSTVSLLVSFCYRTTASRTFSLREPGTCFAGYHGWSCPETLSIQMVWVLVACAFLLPLDGLSHYMNQEHVLQDTMVGAAPETLSIQNGMVFGGTSSEILACKRIGINPFM